MDDDIQLPPLPPFSMAPVADTVTVRDYARAAVLADRERRAKQGAKPVVHSARVVLTPDGSAWSHGGAAECPPPKSTVVTIRWTADGRAWINSERNRELAARLRYWTIDDKFAALDNAADALDGGVR